MKNLRPSQALKPSLDNARSRVNRAEHHLLCLQNEIDAFWRSAHCTISVAPYTTGTFGTTTDSPPSPILSILVGETIYNLRAALDYLIYELAILDSGTIQKETQFPTEDRPTNPRKLRDWQNAWSAIGAHRRLTGINLKHKAMIAAFQPGNGCKWSAMLREISNADKHRRLNAVVTFGEISILQNISGQSQTVRFSCNDTMKMQGKITRKILFDDGSLVVEKLQEIKDEIPVVIDQFAPDFP